MRTRPRRDGAVRLDHSPAGGRDEAWDDLRGRRLRVVHAGLSGRNASLGLAVVLPRSAPAARTAERGFTERTRGSSCCAVHGNRVAVWILKHECLPKRRVERVGEDRDTVTLELVTHRLGIIGAQ